MITTNFADIEMLEFPWFCKNINHADVDYRTKIKEIAPMVEKELGITEEEFSNIFENRVADDYVFDYIKSIIKDLEKDMYDSFYKLTDRYDNGECITFRHALMQLDKPYIDGMIKYYDSIKGGEEND